MIEQVVQITEPQEEELCHIRQILQDATTGDPQARQYLNASFRNAQSMILALTDTSGLVVARAEKSQPLSITNTLLEWLKGSTNITGVDVWYSWVASTTIWLANAAGSWMLLGLHSAALPRQDVLTLIRYWLAHEDCVFLPEWPFSREEIASVFADKHIREVAA